MAMFPIKGDDGEVDEAERIADVMGPGLVDHQIREALRFCWMSLPKERRTLDEVELQIRRVLDRALRDFREDNDAFRKK
jgi:hypothetical protein